MRLLLEHPGQVVTRDKLTESLWAADTFVDFDHSLSAAVAKLRQVLGDSAESPRFIETVAKRGYRFIAPVELDGGLSTETGGAIGPTETESSASAASAFWPAKARRWTGLLVGSAGAFVAMALATWLWQGRAVSRTELVKLTDDTGLTMDPAISADGKLLAYASDRGLRANLNIWIQQVGPGGTAAQLTHDGADAIEPTFSPDGNRIVFSSTRDGGGIYEIPVIGGDASRLAPSGRSPRFSPDGRWIAYISDGGGIQISLGPDGGRIYVVSSTGGEPRALGLDISEAADPVWTRDGNHLIVYVPPKHALTLDGADWWLVAVDGSPSKQTGIFNELKRQGFSLGLGRIPRLSQLDRNSVIFSAGFGDATNAWRMPISDNGQVSGSAERLTSGTTLETSPMFSSNGDLFFTSLNRNTAIWSLPADTEKGVSTGEFKRITEGPAELMPSISTDGRFMAFTAAHKQNGSTRTAVAFSDESAAELHARIRDVSANEERAISSSEPVQWHPQISRDGSMVAYTAGKPGRVYVAPANKGAARLLFSGINHFVWDWSRDNKTLLFNQHDWQIYSGDVGSGKEKVLLTRPNFGLFQSEFSPDDLAVAVVGYHDDVRKDGECQIYVVPLENGARGPVNQWISIDHPSSWDDKPRWSPGGSVLYFISDRDGYMCVWGQRMDVRTWRPTGTPFPVHHLHKPRLAVANLGTGLTEFAVAKDRIVIGLQQVTGNIWSLRRK